MGSRKNRSTGTTAQSLGSLQRQNPQQQWGDVFGNAQELFGFLGDSVSAPFEQFIGRGEETMANSPMAPIFELLGLRANDQMEKEFPGSTTPGPTQPTQPQLTPYDERIQELMTNRDMTRDQAVANQAGAMKAGGDINNNGAITNQEWATKLGSDFDNDGNVTNQEFAQWKQQNPGHQAAGGSMYSGLPGQGGGFAGQQAPQQQQAANPAQGVQINPQIGNLTPEQLAKIQQFQRYSV